MLTSNGRFCEVDRFLHLAVSDDVSIKEDILSSSKIGKEDDSHLMIISLIALFCECFLCGLIDVCVLVCASVV